MFSSLAETFSNLLPIPYPKYTFKKHLRTSTFRGCYRGCQIRQTPQKRAKLRQTPQTKKVKIRQKPQKRPKYDRRHKNRPKYARRQNLPGRQMPKKRDKIRQTPQKKTKICQTPNLYTPFHFIHFILFNPIRNGVQLSSSDPGGAIRVNTSSHDAFTIIIYFLRILIFPY